MAQGKVSQEEVSKYMSYVLRHEPQEAGLDPDEEGWVSLDKLVYDIEATKGMNDAEPVVVDIVANDDKGRYEIYDDEIRATSGHSFDVDLSSNQTDEVPDKLYHGTPKENLGNIFDEGLKSMDREHVHLSDTVDEAVEVGERYASDVVVIIVDSSSMKYDGYDIVEGGERYLVDKVPPEYVSAREP